MNSIEQVRNRLNNLYFPQIVDLRTQVHVAYWSDHHNITKALLDILPFGRIFNPISFYQYIDYQVPQLIEESLRNLLYWSLSGTSHYDGSPATYLSLFFDDTFLWHYYVPAKRQEIIQTIQRGDRIRFLSRFLLSQTKVELEFNEIRLQTINETEFNLVYTDSVEYTQYWDQS